jgi:hypothetical protein
LEAHWATTVTVTAGEDGKRGENRRSMRYANILIARMPVDMSGHGVDLSFTFVEGLHGNMVVTTQMYV